MTAITTNLSPQEVFAARVQERLRASFLEMMPEEMLEQLTTSGIDTFLNGSPVKKNQAHRNNQGYDVKHDPETLPGMIHEALKADFKANQLPKILAQLQPRWGNPDDTGAALVTEIIEKHGSKLMANMLSSFVSQVAYNAANTNQRY